LDNGPIAHPIRNASQSIGGGQSLSTRTADLQGKICLVTGATSGIGLATARALASRGARILLVARNAQKCSRVRREMEAESGNQAIECLIGDLSLKSEIEKLSVQIHQTTPRLDVLINNAGAVFLRRKLNADGIERTLALNHLAYFHLTLKLLDLLQHAEQGRIINISSAMHQSAVLDFDDLQLEHRYSGLKAYRRSKLANLLFTYELARRLEGTAITANAVHPGFVATNIGANNTPLYKLVKPLLRLIARSPQEGAATSIYLATSSEVDGTTGGYFVDCVPTQSSPASYDKEAARQLWDRSLELSGLKTQSKLDSGGQPLPGPEFLYWDARLAAGGPG
jgi:NAD(P)-dependent dehydrogenase (short-subunit alcohol dehydrogenase family)